MAEENDRNRVEWTTRINVRPAARDMIRAMARSEHLSVATTIGMAIETFVAARSTA